jgi:gas vesicle protein
MRKKLKKYTGGGQTPTGAFTQGAGWTGSAAGQGLGMFGGMAGSAIAQADQADGHMSTGGALGSGALKGAAMGMALGPAGALIGAGIGAFGGLLQRNKFNEESRKQEEAEREAERLRAGMENQMKHQQMNQILDQFPVKGNSTPRFEKGGPTGKLGEAMERKDSLMENILEFVDPTGITSYDDAYRAYNSMKAAGRVVPNFEEFVDMLGAVPMVGKVGKVAKASSAAMQTLKTASAGARAASAAGKLMNAADTGQDIYSDNISKQKGMTKTKQPRFAAGGPTGTDPFAKLDPSLRANLRAKQIHPKAAQFKNANPELFSALGELPFDQYSALQSAAQQVKKDVVGLKGQGIGATLDYVNNLDVSALKPLREKAGMSRGELLDSVLGQTNLNWATRQGAKVALRNKEFSAGGPTGGERYFAMPNYGNSMDPNAKPTMDFYIDGQLMPSTDFAKQLPAGMNINDIAAYGYQKAKPTYSPNTGWSYSGQNSYMEDFARMQSGEYMMGGSTAQPMYEAEGGEMIQYKQGDAPAVYGKGGITPVSSQEYEIKGPSHAQGGVDMSDEKGARIYSNKLTVDPELMAKLNAL